MSRTADKEWSCVWLGRELINPHCKRWWYVCVQFRGFVVTVSVLTSVFIKLHAWREEEVVRTKGLKCLSISGSTE